MILTDNLSGDHDHDHDHEKKDLLAEAYSLLKANKPVTGPHGSHSGSQFTSVREIDYKNHHIVIRTRYEIEIDGKIMNNQIYVDNEGKVSSHALPAYSFPSTVDLIKRLVDKFPNSFSSPTGNGETN